MVWEIPGIPRDKVTGVMFGLRRQGNEPEAANQITFYLDNLTLERVPEDHYEGWNVAPGQIAYSQSGYRTDSAKTAIASGSAPPVFSLIRTETGEAVLTKPVEKRQTCLGDFEVMDFTEVNTPGSYWIHAGALSTPPFPIGDDIWRPSLWKALNFFYGERCGTAIPGIHCECHRDWQCEHDGLEDADQWRLARCRRPFAGHRQHGRKPSTQCSRGASGSTPTPPRARWPRAFAKKARGGSIGCSRPALATAFARTFPSWGCGPTAFWETMMISSLAPPTVPITTSWRPAAEAMGSRVLAPSDAERAEHSRKMAESDWKFAVAALPRAGRRGRSKRRRRWLPTGVLASVELWKLTGDPAYRDKAFALAPTLV